MSGFIVESIFDIVDKASPKLTALIKKLEVAQMAADKSSIAFMELGASLDFAGMQMLRLNTEMAASGTSMARLTTRSRNVSTGFRDMAAASRAAYGSFVQTNIQMQEMILSTREAQAAINGLNGSMGRTRPTRPGSPGAPGGGGGGNRGRHNNHYGPGGMFETGIGGWQGDIVGKSIMAMIGFDIVKAGMHPAMEYEQARKGLEGTGLDAKQIRQAENLAGAMHRQLPTTSRGDNLTQIKEIYGTIRNFPETLELAPEFAKFNEALKGMGNRLPGISGNEDHFAKATLKSAETLGQLKPKDFKHFLDQSLRSYESTGGTVTPMHTAQAIKFSRAGRYGKNEDWTFGVLSFLLEEAALGKAGGGSRGVGPLVTGLDRTFGIGGKMDKRLVANFAKLGLFEGAKPGDGIDKHSLSTSTLTTGVTSKIKNERLMTENPFQWFKQEFFPAMRKAEKISKEDFEKLPQADQTAMIKRNALGMQSLVGDAVVQFGINEKQIDKMIDARKHAMDVDKAYNAVMETTSAKARTVGQDFRNLGLELGVLLAPAINSTLDGVHSLFVGIDNLGRNMPMTAQALESMSAKVFGKGGMFDSMSSSLERLGVALAPLTPIFDKMGKAFFDDLGKDAKSMAKMVDVGVDTVSAITNPSEENRKRLLGSALDFVKDEGFGKQGTLSGNVITAVGKPGFKPNDDLEKGVKKIAGQANHAIGGVEQALAGMVFNINFNGPVAEVNKIVEMVKTGIATAMARQAHGHQATASPGGGGNMGNRHTSGG